VITSYVILPCILGQGQWFVREQSTHIHSHGWVLHLLWFDVCCGVFFSVYHGGLGARVRDQAQHDWQSGKVGIVVATVAFG
jgi:hypothetical protein